MQGEADRYRISDPMHDAEQIDSGNPYTTRVMVRRPADASRFSASALYRLARILHISPLAF